MNLSPRGRESRPGAGAAIAKEAGGPFDIVAQAPDSHPRTRRPRYAVMVHQQRRDGVMTTHLMTSLPAAERRVLRTRERGLVAWVELVRLTPLPARLALDAMAGEHR